MPEDLDSSARLLLEDFELVDVLAALHNAADKRASEPWELPEHRAYWRRVAALFAALEDLA